MPTIITRGGMSAKGYGFGALPSSGASIGMSATVDPNPTYDYFSITGNCADSLGNLYITGWVSYGTTGPSGYVHNFLAKYSSTGAFLWGRISTTTNVSFQFNSTCGFYNGNVYWLTKDDTNSMVIIVLPSSGGSLTSVTSYLVASFLTGWSGIDYPQMFVNSSGEMIFGCYSYDSTYSYTGVGRAKLNSNFTVNSYVKSWYVPSTSIVRTGSVPFLCGADGSIHGNFYNQSTYNGTYLATVDSNGNCPNFDQYIGTGIYGARTSDVNGNLYSAVGSSIYAASIKQNSSGAIQWQYQINAATWPGTGGVLITDNNNLYWALGNYNSYIVSLNQSTGAFNWQRLYSKLSLYLNSMICLTNGNPFFVGNNNNGNTNLTFCVAPKTTGGANGTYAGNSITTPTYTASSSSISPAIQSRSSYAWGGSAPVATTTNLRTFSFATSTSAVIPA